MQIEANQSVCPLCGTEVQTFPVLHHMICAYVGPAYDFGPEADGYPCPKCRRGISSDGSALEIVGQSARCPRCCNEMVMSPVPDIGLARRDRARTPVVAREPIVQPFLVSEEDDAHDRKPNRR